MTEPESTRHSLTPILLRFPSESATIRRLLLKDEGFRCLAEDYLLAHKTLEAFRNHAASKKETIEEYAAILRDLEQEINRFLVDLRGRGS